MCGKKCDVSLFSKCSGWHVRKIKLKTVFKSGDKIYHIFALRNLIYLEINKIQVKILYYDGIDDYNKSKAASV